MKEEKIQDDVFWADNIANEVIKRVEKDAFLQKMVKKQGYTVYDEKTPSGNIHIGSGRGWVTHDTIAKALRDKGVKAQFILSSDDMDPLDKPSKELSREENEKYIGVPFRYIPSKVEGYKSFGDCYFSQCTELFGEFGIDAKLESTGEEYEKGSFNKTIKIALDNADKIKKIYTELYGEDSPFANKLPFNVLCPKCKKIATTIALEWDKKKEEVYFECRNDVVKWAGGCGEKGWISPYNGNGKFPWKVEWAAKWPTKSVIVETAGKDHFTKNGSRTVACRIAVDVFGYPPPYPSEGYETGGGYEFFNVGGRKMSTSKGRGIGFTDAISYAPAKMLRFLLVRSRPKAVIDFDPYRLNDMVLLYDRYDEAERAYFGKLELSEKETTKLKRIYEASHVDKIPSRMPPQVNLLHSAMLVQVLKSRELMMLSLKKTGHVPEDVSKAETKLVDERLDFAKKWVEKYAPDEVRCRIQEKVPEGVKFQADLKMVLHKVGKKLREREFTDLELYNIFKNASEEGHVELKEFFKAAYLVLIGKERGPKLSGFILTIGQDKVAKLFSSV